MNLPTSTAPALLPPLHLGAARSFFSYVAGVIVHSARRRACVLAWGSALQDNGPLSPPVLAAWADLQEAQADADASWRALRAAFVALAEGPSAPGRWP